MSTEGLGFSVVCVLTTRKVNFRKCACRSVEVIKTGNVISRQMFVKYLARPVLPIILASNYYSSGDKMRFETKIKG